MMGSREFCPEPGGLMIVTYASLISGTDNVDNLELMP